VFYSTEGTPLQILCSLHKEYKGLAGILPRRACLIDSSSLGHEPQDVIIRPTEAICGRCDGIFLVELELVGILEFRVQLLV
jgi:hypothetical protein